MTLEFLLLATAAYMLLAGLDRALRPIKKPPVMLPFGFPDAFGHGYEPPGPSLISGTAVCLPGGKIISCNPSDPRLTVWSTKVMR